MEIRQLQVSCTPADANPLEAHVTDVCNNSVSVLLLKLWKPTVCGLAQLSRTAGGLSAVRKRPCAYTRVPIPGQPQGVWTWPRLTGGITECATQRMKYFNASQGMRPKQTRTKQFKLKKDKQIVYSR